MNDEIIINLEAIIEYTNKINTICDKLLEKLDKLD